MHCDICLAPHADVLVSTEGGRVLDSAACVRAGHVIVASARHVESFSGLETDELASLMKLLANALRAAEHAMPASRYYVLRVGDKSPHLHFHLIPRSGGDAHLGPFIFGEKGWASTIGQTSSRDKGDVFSNEFKGILGSS